MKGLAPSHQRGEELGCGPRQWRPTHAEPMWAPTQAPYEAGGGSAYGGPSHAHRRFPQMRMILENTEETCTGSRQADLGGHEKAWERNGSLLLTCHRLPRL